MGTFQYVKEHCEIVGEIVLAIIVPVGRPTAWIFPLFCVPTGSLLDDIGVCLNMKCVKEVFQRTRHPLSPIDEFWLDMNGSTVFSIHEWVHSFF